MEKLGIEPQLLLAQLVNFGIIIFVLGKLLYKPILGVLEKRKKEIDEGLAMAAKMAEEEEKLKARKEKVLDAAREEGGKIVEEAKKQATSKEKEIITAAHQESEEIINKGKAEVRRLHDELDKDLRREAVTIAQAMMTRIVPEILKDKEQHRLIDKQLDELSKAKIS